METSSSPSNSAERSALSPQFLYPLGAVPMAAADPLAMFPGGLSNYTSPMVAPFRDSPFFQRPARLMGVGQPISTQVQRRLSPLSASLEFSNSEYRPSLTVPTRSPRSVPTAQRSPQASQDPDLLQTSSQSRVASSLPSVQAQADSEGMESVATSTSSFLQPRSEVGPMESSSASWQGSVDHSSDQSDSLPSVQTDSGPSAPEFAPEPMGVGSSVNDLVQGARIQRQSEHSTGSIQPSEAPGGGVTPSPIPAADPISAAPAIQPQPEISPEWSSEGPATPISTQSEISNTGLDLSGVSISPQSISSPIQPQAEDGAGFLAPEASIQRQAVERSSETPTTYPAGEVPIQARPLDLASGSPVAGPIQTQSTDLGSASRLEPSADIPIQAQPTLTSSPSPVDVGSEISIQTQTLDSLEEAAPIQHQSPPSANPSDPIDLATPQLSIQRQVQSSAEPPSEIISSPPSVQRQSLDAVASPAPIQPQSSEPIPQSKGDVGIQTRSSIDSFPSASSSIQAQSSDLIAPLSSSSFSEAPSQASASSPSSAIQPQSEGDESLIDPVSLSTESGASQIQAAMTASGGIHQGDVNQSTSSGDNSQLPADQPQVQADLDLAASVNETFPASALGSSGSGSQISRQTQISRQIEVGSAGAEVLPTQLSPSDLQSPSGVDGTTSPPALQTQSLEGGSFTSSGPSLAEQSASDLGLQPQSDPALASPELSPSQGSGTISTSASSFPTVQAQTLPESFSAPTVQTQVSEGSSLASLDSISEIPASSPAPVAPALQKSITSNTSPSLDSSGEPSSGPSDPGGVVAPVPVQRQSDPIDLPVSSPTPVQRSSETVGDLDPPALISESSFLSTAPDPTGWSTANLPSSSEVSASGDAEPAQINRTAASTSSTDPVLSQDLETGPDVSPQLEVLGSQPISAASPAGSGANLQPALEPGLPASAPIQRSGAEDLTTETFGSPEITGTQPTLQPSVPDSSGMSFEVTEIGTASIPTARASSPPESTVQAAHSDLDLSRATPTLPVQRQSSSTGGSEVGTYAATPDNSVESSVADLSPIQPQVQPLSESAQPVSSSSTSIPLMGSGLSQTSDPTPTIQATVESESDSDSPEIFPQIQTQANPTGGSSLPDQLSVLPAGPSIQADFAPDLPDSEATDPVAEDSLQESGDVLAGGESDVSSPSLSPSTSAGSEDLPTVSPQIQARPLSESISSTAPAPIQAAPGAEFVQSNLDLDLSSASSLSQPIQTSIQRQVEAAQANSDRSQGAIQKQAETVQPSSGVEGDSTRSQTLPFSPPSSPVQASASEPTGDLVSTPAPIQRSMSQISSESESSIETLSIQPATDGSTDRSVDPAAQSSPSLQPQATEATEVTNSGSDLPAISLAVDEIGSEPVAPASSPISSDIVQASDAAPVNSTSATEGAVDFIANSLGSPRLSRSALALQAFQDPTALSVESPAPSLQARSEIESIPTTPTLSGGDAGTSSAVSAVTSSPIQTSAIADVVPASTPGTLQPSSAVDNSSPSATPSGETSLQTSLDSSVGAFGEFSPSLEQQVPTSPLPTLDPSTGIQRTALESVAGDEEEILSPSPDPAALQPSLQATSDLGGGQDTTALSSELTPLQAAPAELLSSPPAIAREVIQEDIPEIQTISSAFQPSQTQSLESLSETDSSLPGIQTSRASVDQQALPQVQPQSLESSWQSNTESIQAVPSIQPETTPLSSDLGSQSSTSDVTSVQPMAESGSSSQITIQTDTVPDLRSWSGSESSGPSFPSPSIQGSSRSESSSDEPQLPEIQTSGLPGSSPNSSTLIQAQPISGTQPQAPTAVTPEIQPQDDGSPSTDLPHIQTQPALSAPDWGETSPPAIQSHSDEMPSSLAESPALPQLQARFSTPQIQTDTVNFSPEIPTQLQTPQLQAQPSEPVSPLSTQPEFPAVRSEIPAQLDRDLPVASPQLQTHPDDLDLPVAPRSQPQANFPEATPHLQAKSDLGSPGTPAQIQAQSDLDLSSTSQLQARSDLGVSSPTETAQIETQSDRDPSTTPQLQAQSSLGSSSASPPIQPFESSAPTAKIQTQAAQEEVPSAPAQIPSVPQLQASREISSTSPQIPAQPDQVDVLGSSHAIQAQSNLNPSPIQSQSDPEFVSPEPQLQARSEVESPASPQIQPSPGDIPAQTHLSQQANLDLSEISPQLQTQVAPEFSSLQAQSAPRDPELPEATPQIQAQSAPYPNSSVSPQAHPSSSGISAGTSQVQAQPDREFPAVTPQLQAQFQQSPPQPISETPSLSPQLQTQSEPELQAQPEPEVLASPSQIPSQSDLETSASIPSIQAQAVSGSPASPSQIQPDGQSTSLQAQSQDLSRSSSTSGSPLDQALSPSPLVQAQMAPEVDGEDPNLQAQVSPSLQSQTTPAEIQPYSQIGVSELQPQRSPSELLTPGRTTETPGIHPQLQTKTTSAPQADPQIETSGTQSAPPQSQVPQVQPQSLTPLGTTPLSTVQPLSSSDHFLSTHPLIQSRSLSTAEAAAQVAEPTLAASPQVPLQRSPYPSTASSPSAAPAPESWSNISELLGGGPSQSTPPTRVQPSPDSSAQYPALTYATPIMAQSLSIPASPGMIEVGKTSSRIQKFNASDQSPPPEPTVSVTKESDKSTSEAPGEMDPNDEDDHIEFLAREIYWIVQQKMTIEREREGSHYRGRLRW